LIGNDSNFYLYIYTVCPYGVLGIMKAPIVVDAQYEVKIN